MWREIKVLLVDDNEQRKHDMHVLFDFLGEESFSCSTSSWKDEAAKVEDPMDIVALVLGASDNRPVSDVLNEISDWDKGMPIIYVGDEA